MNIKSLNLLQVMSPVNILVNTTVIPNTTKSFLIGKKKSH